MELYGQQSKSIPQKIIIHIIEIILIWLSYSILFKNGGNWVENYLGIQNQDQSVTRRIVIFIFNIIIFLRLGYMMIFLLKRKIPWEESISVPMAFAVYYIGFSLFVLPTIKNIDLLDYFAIALFVLGCTLNTSAEILRKKKIKKMEGKT